MRRITTISIEDRGVLKNFELQELPALQLEHWAIRLGKMLLRTDILSSLDIDHLQSSADLPLILAKIINGGTFARLADIDMAEYESLEAQMLQSISIVQPSGAKMKLSPVTIEGNIEDYRTIAKLVFEAVKFNLNFSSPAAPSPASAPGQTKAGAGRKPSISLRS